MFESRHPQSAARLAKGGGADNEDLPGHFDDLGVMNGSNHDAHV